MDAEFPSVSKRFDHLGFLVKVLILIRVSQLSFVREGLKIRAVFDAIGRVDVDHLNLAAHALLGQQRVHHQEAVARHQPVRPALFVVVEIQRLAQRQVLERRREQVRLPPLRRRILALQPPGRIGEDRRRVHPFVHMQRDGIDLDAGPLRFARPVQIGRLQPLQFLQRVLHPFGIARGQRIVDQPFDSRARRVEVQHRVEMRVIGPDRLVAIRIGAGMDHAHLGVVHPRLAMAVGQHLHRPVRPARGLLPGLGPSLARRGLDGVGQFEPIVLVALILIQVVILIVRFIGDTEDRPATALATPQHALIDQRIARGDVVVFGKVRHVLAQQRQHGSVADGGTVFG